MNENEIWKDIPNYTGLYQVSNYGRVTSLDRVVVVGLGFKKIKGNILIPQQLNSKKQMFGLCKDGDRVKFDIHDLVKMSFKYKI